MKKNNFIYKKTYYYQPFSEKNIFFWIEKKKKCIYSQRQYVTEYQCNEKPSKLKPAN